MTTKKELIDDLREARARLSDVIQMIGAPGPLTPTKVTAIRERLIEADHATGGVDWDLDEMINV